MKRHLFTVASALSLLLFAATLGLWASSLRREMFCEHTSFSPYRAHWYWLNWQVWSEDGFLRWASTGVETNTARFESTWAERPGQWEWKIEPRGARGLEMGFPENLWPRWDIVPAYAPGRADVIRSRYIGIILPYWVVLAVALPLPVFWTIRHRRRVRRRELLLCRFCGYNLTGNTSGMCPECGAACKAASPAGASPAAGD